MRIYIPLDSAAVALGADEVASSIAAYANASGMDVDIVRNGSHGMVWLEPLVEIETDGVRRAFGPVTPAHVPALMAAKWSVSALWPNCRSSPAKRA